MARPEIKLAKQIWRGPTTAKAAGLAPRTAEPELQASNRKGRTARQNSLHRNSTGKNRLPR